MCSTRLKWWYEKFKAYRAEETFDPNLVAEVNNIWEQHSKELNEVWRQTSLKERDNLVQAFRKELEKEWSTEVSEILLEKVFHATEERLIISIRMAYIAGYMMGKGWISMEQLSNYNLCLGDNLANHIRSVLKRAKSRGIAFASAFTSVGVEGHLATLASHT